MSLIIIVTDCRNDVRIREISLDISFKEMVINVLKNLIMLGNSEIISTLGCYIMRSIVT